MSTRVSLHYLSSSSFSRFSLSSFSLCSRASRLFSASSLVASSGSVVPAEVFGEALAVRVDDGAGVGGWGGGWGRRLGRSCRWSNCTNRYKEKANWKQKPKNKTKLASPDPRPRIHHYKRKGMLITGVLRVSLYSIRNRATGNKKLHVRVRHPKLTLSLSLILTQLNQLATHIERVLNIEPHIRF